MYSYTGLPGVSVKSNFRMTPLRFVLAILAVSIGLMVWCWFGQRFNIPVRRRPQSERVKSTPLQRPRRKRLTAKQKKEVLQRFEHRCGMCRKVLERFDTDFDHRVCLSSYKHGVEWDLNDVRNFWPLCSRCHRWKSDGERKAGLYRSRRRVSQ
jgi:5-methylcytosine-specific restriction endonuclease McrA